MLLFLSCNIFLILFSVLCTECLGDAWNNKSFIVCMLFWGILPNTRLYTLSVINTCFPLCYNIHYIYWLHMCLKSLMVSPVHLNCCNTLGWGPLHYTCVMTSCRDQSWVILQEWHICDMTAVASICVAQWLQQKKNTKHEGKTGVLTLILFCQYEKG